MEINFARINNKKFIKEKNYSIKTLSKMRKKIGGLCCFEVEPALAEHFKELHIALKDVIEEKFKKRHT